MILSFSNGHVGANSVNPDQTSPSANSVDQDQTAPDQGLHCLSFHFQLLQTLLYGKTILFKF